MGWLVVAVILWMGFWDFLRVFLPGWVAWDMPYEQYILRSFCEIMIWAGWSWLSFLIGMAIIGLFV